MSKQLKFILAVAGIFLTLLGMAIGYAYRAGCEAQKVETVSEVQSEQRSDIKEIKKDVGELKTDVAVMKSGIADIKEWMKPTKEAFNAVRK